jgi:hypothetical protein
VLVQGEPEVALVQGEPAEVAFVQAEPAEVAFVQAEPAEVALVQGKPAEMALFQAEPAEMALVQGEPAEVALVQGEPGEALVLMDKSGLDVAPGHHREVPVDQMEPGRVVHQAGAVGGTENQNSNTISFLQQLYLWYDIKHYHRTQYTFIYRKV